MTALPLKGNGKTVRLRHPGTRFYGHIPRLHIGKQVQSENNIHIGKHTLGEDMRRAESIFLRRLKDQFDQDRKFLLSLFQNLRRS